MKYVLYFEITYLKFHKKINNVPYEDVFLNCTFMFISNHLFTINYIQIMYKQPRTTLSKLIYFILYNSKLSTNRYIYFKFKKPV